MHLATLLLVILLPAVAVPSAAAASYDINNYFPLQADSQWTLQDVDGSPADDEGFAWVVSGSGPQAVGSHAAWRIDTDARVTADSRESDAQFWHAYNGQADLGLYGLYEKAGASPLAANQTIAFGQPLHFGTERMVVDWQSTSSASATFQVTLPLLGTVAAPGTVAATVTLVEHLDQLSTPLGLFHDVLVLTADVSGTASYFGYQVYQGTLFQGTLFLARGVGLIRSTRTLNPTDPEAQAISGGQLGGVAIVPPPPPPEQGITLSASGTETGEDGSRVTATLVLDAEPRSPVTVVVTCDDPSEGHLAPGTNSVARVFTPADWDMPQDVPITGVNDTEWDGRQAYHVTLALDTADPDYATLDSSQWTLTLTNRDDEALDIGDYFVLLPASQWRYQWFDDESGPIVPARAEYAWSVEETQPLLHGVPVTAIRTDTDEPANPLNGTANLWSLDPTGSLLLHGVRLPVGFERDVDYLGGTYHVVVPPQTLEFALPLVTGSRGMVTHEPIIRSTTADVRVTGLPLVSTLPVTVTSRAELLGRRERKRTPVGVFTQVPVLLLTVSIEALGESVQDQGGVLFLARNVGVICQNAATQPQSPQGMALAAGRVGTTPVVADDPNDRVLRLNLTLQPGWNLIALPFRPLNSAPAAVFGAAISGHAWERRGNAYAAATALHAGHAYWVYRNPLAAPDNAPIEILLSGSPEPVTTRPVDAGWLCLGAISEDPTAALTLPLLSGSTPVCRLAWTWGPGGFQPRRELPVGAGAWLFIEARGTIDLAPATVAR